ncbi:GTP-binding protein TypA/BipA [Cutibacterium acnes JCM 18918]|nr:GTP-binding protein TypA/BipA [Cutibacterium acnes JCM 18918]
MTEALERVPAEKAGPGDIVAIAGIPEITIGETLSDPENPVPLPLIHVDEPSMSMTIGINTSPLSGRSGDKLTARLLKARLDQELIGNVSIKVADTDRPDMWEVQGRGELQLAVLVEQMRREGFELTVGKPQVVTKTIDGKLHEPFERVTIDAPEEFMGPVTQMMGLRKGQMMHMVNHGSGWVRMEFVVPAWPYRLPHRVPHPDPRSGHHEPDLRELPALGRRIAHPSEWLDGRRPSGGRHLLRLVQLAGARHDVRLAGRGHLRGHGRRRKLAPRRHGRQPHQRKAPHQRALFHRRRVGAPDPGDETLDGAAA